MHFFVYLRVCWSETRSPCFFRWKGMLSCWKPAKTRKKGGAGGKEPPGQMGFPIPMVKQGDRRVVLTKSRKPACVVRGTPLHRPPQKSRDAHKSRSVLTT